MIHALPVDQGEFLTLVRSAEGGLLLAETALSIVEARVRLVDVAMNRLRLFAHARGLSTSRNTEAPPRPQAPFRMSSAELATFCRLSPRKLAMLKTSMIAGTHFHYVGRRLIFHGPEAVDFIDKSSSRKSEAKDFASHTTDQVLQRRAQLALRRSAR